MGVLLHKLFVSRGANKPSYLSYKWVVAFGVVMFLDGLTTYIALSLGLKELNPILRPIAGFWWFMFVKLAVGLLLGFWIRRISSLIMVLAVILYGIIALWNYGGIYLCLRSVLPFGV